jgi:hypothetical protein
MHGLKHPEEVAAMLKAILLVLVFKAFRKALCFSRRFDLRFHWKTWEPYL